MKKLLRYLIGLGDKAPPLPQKRILPAHELALKQASARRRDEKAKADGAGMGGGSATSELPPVAKRAAPVDGEVVARGGGESQSPASEKNRPEKNRPEENRRKERKAKHLAGGGAGARATPGGYEPMHQLADISMGSGLGHAKRRAKHAGVDAGAVAGKNREMKQGAAKAGAGVGGKKQRRKHSDQLVRSKG